METISANWKLLREPRQPAKYHRNSKATAKSSTPAFCGNDFLKSKFAPLVAQRHKELSNQKEIESGFFKSLSNLSKLYDLDKGEFELMSYPVNLFKTFEYVKQQLSALRSDLTLTVIQDTKNPCVFVTTKTFCTGNTLYYIPIEPVYRLMQDKEMRKSANLLLSVLAYVYQIIRISHFRECDSYLFYTYDMIREWTKDLLEEEDEQEMLEEFVFMQKAGDFVLAEMKKKIHLSAFSRRLNAYKPTTVLESVIFNTATSAYKLMSSYPNRSIYQNINENLLTEKQQDDGVIRAENYMSFFWSNTGAIQDQLWEAVNCELQEYNQIDEPTTVQYFNTTQIQEEHDHDFEKQLFKLLDDLCDTLNTL